MHYSSPSYLLLACLAMLAIGCSSSDDTKDNKMGFQNPKGEYLYRKHDEFFFSTPSPTQVATKTYSWDKSTLGDQTKITKEFFRCKGSSLNPRHVSQQNGEAQHQFDCGGAQKHSLPLKEGKEFIYPILIDLVNFIQDQTGKKVVITCGHRCPEHNTYADPSPSNQYSKHMIGAEVAFYVQGYEEQPEKIVNLIQEFYKNNPRYQNQKEFLEFKRYEKSDSNTAIQPWFNKEIFLKIFSKTEGRNFDNRHPYPYISIQVRYDRENKENVTYSWDKAFRNFHRW